MDRGAAEEAMLIQISRWQREEADRLGLPLYDGKPVEEPAYRGTGPHPLAKETGMTDTSLDAARIASTGLIVAARLSQPHFQLGASGTTLADLISEVRGALEAPVAAAPVEAPPEELKPAVPIRKSVTDDFIICLEDGKKFKSLKRHLKTHFGLTPEQYRDKWKLPTDYPMVAPNYSATRSKLAKDNGLGKKAA